MSEIITDGQAKRLAARYATGATTPLAVLYWTGRVLPTASGMITGEVFRTLDHRLILDSHGALADARALADYFQAYKGREPVEGWRSVPHDDTVVPWAYGH